MKEYKRVRAKENDRGYLVEITGTMKDNGQFSFNPDERIEVAQKILEALFDKKFEIRIL